VTMTFDAADRRQLEQRELSFEEAERQLAYYRQPPAPIRLDRPSTIGDGIVRLEQDSFDELLAAHAAAAERGRFTKFVPASGAASRMFKELLHFQKGPGRSASWGSIEQAAAAGESAAAALVEVMQNVGEFAFAPELQGVLGNGEELTALARSGDFQRILDALLSPSGMNYESLPKGLLRFHRYESGPRTPLEEHLVEALHQVRDAHGVCRLHFTVSPEHLAGFTARVDEVQSTYADAHGASFKISFSFQKPSTDTVTVEPDGTPLRDADGRLFFRPGGHGALIENLADLAGDLVFVKNIDNVQSDHAKEATLLWKRLLAGYLVQLQGHAFEHLGRLGEPEPKPEHLDAARLFAERELNLELQDDRAPLSFQALRAQLISRLNRPLRVCGVVPNTGEPGGGPFWVRAADDSIGSQIVEAAEVDSNDSAQQEILHGSTHFNPVDLVCAVSDAQGRPYDLASFVNPDSAMISHKSVEGRDVLALERPGLWNGAMAGWNTIFVEVPLATFSPVKSVLDLLREPHR